MASLRSSAASDNDSGSVSLTIAKPSGALDGDTMILGMAARGGSNQTMFQPTLTAQAAGSQRGEPDELAFSPDGAYLYAGCYYDEGAAAPNGLLAIDLSNFTVVAEPDTNGGSGGYSSTLFVSNTKAYTSLGTTNGADIFRTSDHTRTGSISGTVGNWYSRGWSNGTKAYLATTTGIVRVTVSTDTVAATMGGGFGSDDVCPTSDGVYVLGMSNNNPNRAYRITVSDDSSTFLADASFNSLRAVSIERGDDYAWYSVSTGSIKVIQISDMTLVATLSPPTGMYYVECSPYSDHAVAVSSSGANDYMTIYDTVTREELKRILVSNAFNYGTIYGAGRIAFTPDGKWAYVPGQLTSSGGPCVFVLDLVNLSLYATINIRPDGTIGHARRCKYHNGAVYATQFTYPARVIKLSDKPWKELGKDNSGTTLIAGVWAREHDGDPSTFATMLQTSEHMAAVQVAVKGTTVNDLVAAIQDNASSTSVSTPALSSLAGRDGLDLAFLSTAYATTMTPPSAYDEPSGGEAASNDTSSGVTQAVASRPYQAIQSIAALTGTAGNAAVNVGAHVFAAKPDPNTYEVAVQSTDPAAYWRLGDSGSTLVDIAGGFDATKTAGQSTGATGALTNDANQAISMDGSTAGADVSLSLDVWSNDFTLEAWAMADDSTTRTLFVREGSGSSGYRFGKKGLRWAFWTTDSGGSVDVQDTSDLTTGVWYHIVAVRWGGKFLLYVDGQLKSEGTGTYTVPSGGNQKLGGTSGAEWKGDIDELTVYPFALSAASIYSHWLGGKFATFGKRWALIGSRL